MTQIEFAGHGFSMSPEGTLYWHAEHMLVVADLHLEKGSHFAMRGQFLPPYDTRETLERLERAIKNSSASRILFLGDSFHDATGPERMSYTERDMLEDMCGALQAIWVQGNHDGSLRPARRAPVRGVFFKRHHLPARGDQGTVTTKISGHYPPLRRDRA